MRDAFVLWGFPCLYIKSRVSLTWWIYTEIEMPTWYCMIIYHIILYSYRNQYLNHYHYHISHLMTSYHIIYHIIIYFNAMKCVTLNWTFQSVHNWPIEVRLVLFPVMNWHRTLDKLLHEQTRSNSLTHVRRDHSEYMLSQWERGLQ